MRIVSKFHDFYDIGLGLGYDSHVDYIRTPREIKFDEAGRLEDKSTKEFFSNKFKYFHTSWSVSTHLEYVIIGFCGVFYPLVIATKAGTPKYCYSLEELSEVIEISRWSGYKEFFDTVKALKNDELFITNYSPIVVVELNGLKTKATWNALLRPYLFVRVVDPYQAFQKIEMFLGNMAAPEKPMPKQTDIEKVKSHGFDPKMGFRKGK